MSSGCWPSASPVPRLLGCMRLGWVCHWQSQPRHVEKTHSCALKGAPFSKGNKVVRETESRTQCNSIQGGRETRERFSVEAQLTKKTPAFDPRKVCAGRKSQPRAASDNNAPRNKQHTKEPSKGPRFILSETDRPYYRSSRIGVNFVPSPFLHINCQPAQVKTLTT
jgi:hypothetical protein